MSETNTFLFQVLDTLIKVLLPIAVTLAMNFLVKKLGREKFLMSKDIIGSIVATLEQQYRSGEIPKDDRFSLALDAGIKKTGLSQAQVAELIKEAVFAINVQMGKYSYPTAPGFSLQGDATPVFEPSPVKDNSAEGAPEDFADKRLVENSEV